MTKTEDIENILREAGFDSFRWISGADIVTANWVRMKCMFGCPIYGKRGTCPPNTPSVRECTEFFHEYNRIVVIHVKGDFDEPEARHAWSVQINESLLKVERSVFLMGFYKVFLMFMASCRECDTCERIKIDCNNPQAARPTPEAFGVDVFATAHGCGLPIDVLTDYSDSVNKYALLLVD